MPDSATMRVAVVSPFLDKRHGTERIAVEWLSHLPGMFELHLYSQRVEDIDHPFVWHRIPEMPGPHLLNFLWWLIANYAWRLWDTRVRGRRYDLTYSPGANCLDADAISVHIVFGDYIEEVRPLMRMRTSRVRSWPRLLHRKLYYRVARWMERIAYTNQRAALILYAQKTGGQLRRLYGRSDELPVLYLGVDHKTYNVQRREQLRLEARKHLGLVDNSFVLLLIGNDWRNKGVPCLMEAAGRLLDLPIHVLIVTAEHSTSPDSLAASGIRGRLSVLPPRSDVEFYYAAADAYVGPSLEDTFGLPPQEAMACGLPVIVSAANGTSEIITDGVDGLILQNPTDAEALAGMIRRLHDDPEFRATLGENAAQTAMQYTWDRNGRELAAIFLKIIERKAAQLASSPPSSATHPS